MTTLSRLRIAGGTWEGVMASAAKPDLSLRHRDEVVGTPDVAQNDAGGWFVRFDLPVDRLSDGVQTFVIEDRTTGEALASETVIAGVEAGMDLRAEVDLLRAELDMLKRAFRRHCTDI